MKLGGNTEAELVWRKWALDLIKIHSMHYEVLKTTKINTNKRKMHKSPFGENNLHSELRNTAEIV